MLLFFSLSENFCPSLLVIPSWKSSPFRSFQTSEVPMIFVVRMLFAFTIQLKHIMFESFCFQWLGQRRLSKAWNCIDNLWKLLLLFNSELGWAVTLASYMMNGTEVVLGFWTEEGWMDCGTERRHLKLLNHMPDHASQPRHHATPCIAFLVATLFCSPPKPAFPFIAVPNFIRNLIWPHWLSAVFLNLAVLSLHPPKVLLLPSQN